MNKLTVAYVRLSQEDMNKLKDFSESIYNQISLIKSYAKSRGLKIDKEYIDDGFSGTNFDRPGFKELIVDIEKGIVGVIITKDMSRLGRNFIETAYYISDYFPKYGVRYIAINDEFYSENLNSCEHEFMLGFRSLINDRYVKDSSIKRKQIAEVKTSEKQFIGFIAPYGYKVVKQDGKRTLQIDEYASCIVKRIFTEIASGKTRHEVADDLNKDNIISPMLYMNMTPSRNKRYYYEWTDKIIYRILKNKTYTGKIVKRKTSKKSYLQKKRDVIPIRDREIIDNCHPIIITEQLFNEANNKLRVIKKREKNDYCGLFNGLVICGECGRKMTVCKRNDRSDVKYFFYCKKVVDRKSCFNRTIVDSKLRTALVSTLQEIIEDYVSEEELAARVVKNLIRAERPNLKILYLQKDIELHKKYIRNLYLQKTKGEITLKQFLEAKNNEIFLKEESEKLLQEILESKNEDRRKEKILEQFRCFINNGELMNSFLRDLVDRIVVYKDNTIKVVFSFCLGEPKKIRLF